jgi:NTE family protein
MSPRPPIIGLALGGGAARGLSHLGVLRSLDELGVRADVVCGTSIGALIGAAYVCEGLDALESWVRSLDLGDVVRYLDLRLAPGGGFADGENLIELLRERIGDPDVEELPRTFAAVATDLATGRELWLREGNLWDAVRASIAVPGILTPTPREGRWLVDGGLVNPVPVSVCRALGAEIVLAVNLTGGVTGRHLSRRIATPPVAGEGGEDGEDGGRGFLGRLKQTFTREDWARELFRRERSTPTVFEVLASSLDIMEDRITRSRMAGDPPDLTLSPRIHDVELIEFHRAEEAIQAGRDAVERERSHLLELLGPHLRSD